MLALTGLRKNFGKLTAVRDLTVRLAAGELFGFLGPNGAGKTTTIKMIAGLLEPSAGRIVINGIDLATDPVAAKRITGYVPDRPYLYGKLTPRELLELVGGLYGIPRAQLLADAADWFEKFRLTNWEDELIENFSHGMKQKVVLVSALIIRPRLLVVDEPMVGLDPHAAHLAKAVFRDFCARGGTIFCSTHTLSVAEEICTRVGIINRGELVALGTPAELRTTAGLERARLEEIFLNCTEEEARPSDG